MKARVRAPAKINLTLHVTGQRADGYHLLDSLVVFGPMHDVLDITDAPSPSGEGLSIRVTGPEAAGVPEDRSNLVLRAADLLTDRLSVTLTKTLPPASGIGGGSADAAAVLRALILSKLPDTPTVEDVDGLLIPMMAELKLETLGADVPMCMMNTPLRVTGIGEKAEPQRGIPPVKALLINPRRPVSTPQVFRAMQQRDNPPMPAILPEMPDAAALIAFLKTMRNDMQAAAIQIEPTIAEVLETLEGIPGCGLARMSGSGATCFGLFADATPEEISEAARRIGKAHPDWWLAAGELGSQVALGLPEFG
jgi:4-diphosphocytidyl-2-C-methyl-D-erythritol kinase